MRQKRKKSEEQAITALKNLVSLTNDITEDPFFVDQPDALFSIKGEKIAVECRLIGIEKIYQWSNFKKRLGKNYKIELPFQPHVWVNYAIHEKSKKIETYKKRSGAKKCWLLLHTPSLPDATFFDLTPNVLSFMEWGAYNTSTNDFDEIWIYDSEFGAARIYKKDVKITFNCLDPIRVPIPIIHIVEGFYKVSKEGLKIDAKEIYQSERIRPLMFKY